MKRLVFFAVPAVILALGACDLTGVGVQDTAIAMLAYRKAMEKGLGLHIQV